MRKLITLQTTNNFVLSLLKKIYGRMLTVRNQQEFDQFCQVLQGYVVYKPTRSKQVEFWTEVRWGRGAFWGLNIAGKNTAIESSGKKIN